MPVLKSLDHIAADGDTLEDDHMDPENHWLVEENTLPGGQDVRVYVSFRECTLSTMQSAMLLALGAGDFQ